MHDESGDKVNINRHVKRISYFGYVEFFLSIGFWVGAGINAFSGISSWVYLLMAGVLLCSIVIVISSVCVEKFYLYNIKEYLTDLENLNIKLRTQRHEYLNEMQVVYGLLELNEYEDALEYLKPIYADIAKVGKALKTSRPAVNALLRAKMEHAEKNQVELFVEVSSALEGIKLEQWDLCKIIGNLVDNAVTAVAVNENEKQVHIHISEDSSFYRISVYNNGPVIPRDKMDLIFKKGYSSKKEQGHGLGLGIIRDIVTLCHGNINVSSQEGKTEFEVVIPK